MGLGLGTAEDDVEVLQVSEQPAGDLPDIEKAAGPEDRLDPIETVAVVLY